MFYMITGDKCSYCNKAKELLTEKGIGFTAYSYTDHEMLLPLMFKAGLKTIPQIWVQGGDYIGGYDDLVEYLNQVKE